MLWSWPGHGQGTGSMRICFPSNTVPGNCHGHLGRSGRCSIWDSDNTCPSGAAICAPGCNCCLCIGKRCCCIRSMLWVWLVLVGAPSSPALHITTSGTFQSSTMLPQCFTRHMTCTCILRQACHILMDTEKICYKLGICLGKWSHMIQGPFVVYLTRCL